MAMPVIIVVVVVMMAVVGAMMGTMMPAMMAAVMMAAATPARFCELGKADGGDAGSEHCRHGEGGGLAQ
jgi:hypothetical protein